jgi:hypothetical protein
MAIFDMKGGRRGINDVAAADWLSLELIVNVIKINQEMMVSTNDSSMSATWDGNDRECFSEKVCKVLRLPCGI